MSDSSDDTEAYSGFFDEEDTCYSDKEIEILKYCKPHLDKMWASRVASIILGCEYRDCSIYIDEAIENYDY